MTIQEALPTDYDWINQQYKAIDFLQSDFKKDYVVIAKMEGEPVGIGRLVPVDDHSKELGGMFVLPKHRKKGIAGKIVEYLMSKTEGLNIVWCIPFAHLTSFYGQYGFQKIDPATIELPKKIFEKYNWCASSYPNDVSFMIKKEE